MTQDAFVFICWTNCNFTAGRTCSRSFFIPDRYLDRICESNWGDLCHCGLARQCFALNVVLKLMPANSACPAGPAAKRSTSHLMPLPSRAARSQRNAEIVSSQKSGCSWTSEWLSHPLWLGNGPPGGSSSRCQEV